jgi:hypothetical protein
MLFDENDTIEIDMNSRQAENLTRQDDGHPVSWYPDTVMRSRRY